jgi:RNA polymerase sigma factor (sigma-70 family)
MDSHKHHIEPLYTEQEAWELLRSGEMKGLELLFRIYFSDLHRFGLALVSDEDFISDIIQEVFLDLWKYQKSLPKVENIRYYLFKTLSNKIKREQKKQKAIKRSEWKDAEGKLYSPSFEESWIGFQQDEELRIKLAKGIESLPLRQKEIVQYLFFEKLSYEDCARILEINLRSVYTLAWKAIKSLRKHVEVLLLFCFF